MVIRLRANNQTARPAKSWVPHPGIQANKNNRWPKSFTLCFVKSMQMLYIYIYMYIYIQCVYIHTIIYYIYILSLVWWDK